MSFEPLKGVRVLAIYGGRAYEPQIEALKNGIDVVVGTPGRVIDLAQRRDLDERPDQEPHDSNQEPDPVL